MNVAKFNLNDDDPMEARSQKDPLFSNLDLWERRGQKGVSFAQGMHPNPRFYKYYWHVFSRDSKFEGAEFFARCRMSTYEALNEIAKLKKAGKTYIIYNRSLPRSGPDTPFSKSKSTKWAPAYDDDPDLPWGKMGHK